MELIRSFLLLALSALLVACSQKSAPTSPDPTVQAQAAQIAALQQQVAALQAAAPQRNPPPTAALAKDPVTDTEDNQYKTAIAAGIEQLKKGVPWGPVWNSIKARFPNKPDEQIDVGLGIEWREAGAYETYIAKQPAPQTAVAGQAQQSAPRPPVVSATAPPIKASQAPPATQEAAARAFIQALVSGETNLALQLFPIASTDATWRATLPGISGALRACSSSQTDASSAIPMGGVILVQLTPPCGNYGSFYDAMPLFYQPIMNAFAPVDVNRARPLDRCSIAVAAVNNQWKVDPSLVCLPPER